MNIIKDKRNIRIRVFAFIILTILTLFFVAPYVWMLLNSFKSTKEILLHPTNILPEEFTIKSYQKVLFDSPFVYWFRNSLIVTVVDTVVILFTSSIIGFVLSKYKFKLNKFCFFLILATMMMPTTAMMIPNFLIISKLGWYDKIISLIVPTFCNAFGIFLCKQFIDDLPKELFESAMLDNASDFKIFYRIVIPAIRPALGSLAIFTFLGIWNDYQTPLIYLNSTKNMTLPLALSFFNSQHLSDLSATMAAAALIMVPSTVVFLIFQKYFIKGISMTGMK